MQKQRCKQKSRAGCRNCKLRKLKCDETRPQCKRCITYGVLCNIKFNVPDFQPCTQKPIRQGIRRDKLEAPRPPICSAVWTADASISFMIDAKCQYFIRTFKSQSVFSGDDSIWMESKDKLVSLAFIYPFLMHGILALTAIHERYLSPWSSNRRTLRESYHWSQCTTLFNRRLSLPIEPQDRDAIWGTASTLNHITFSSLDASTPEESWPLKPPGPSDLEWLRLGSGKMALWNATEPLRPDSLFNVMADTLAQMNSPLQATGVDGIPVDLALICNLDESSTAENNPYFLVVHVVSQLYRLSDDRLVTGKVLSFIRHMPPSFKSLLQIKDHVALLILYLWYCRARRSTWWIELRARVECPAICMYLRRYHKGNSAIEVFLPKEQSLKAEDYKLLFHVSSDNRTSFGLTD